MLETITAEQIEKYRALFRQVTDEKNWKFATKEFRSLDKATAEQMRDAIIFFVGGAEIIETSSRVRFGDGLVSFAMPEYVVTSKGYYHYCGA